LPHEASPLAQCFANLDVVVSPTMPLTAWHVGEQRVRVGAREESVLAVSWRLTYPWNLLGFPSVLIRSRGGIHSLRRPGRLAV